MVIIDNGVRIDLEQEEEVERKAVKVVKWYDRSRREWLLFAVDKDWCQIGNARRGFSKMESDQIEKDLKEEYGIK